LLCKFHQECVLNAIFIDSHLPRASRLLAAVVTRRRKIGWRKKRSAEKREVARNWRGRKEEEGKRKTEKTC
jgi:hypothetical protein